MKQAFTMIELIFVIVILGIIAAVAIPRLAATRDDAIIAQAATNFDTFEQELIGYYMAKGYVEKDMQSMTNVQLKNVGEYTADFYVGKDPCVSIKIDPNSYTELATVTPVSDPSLRCSTFQSLLKIQQATTYGILPVKRDYVETNQ